MMRPMHWDIEKASWRDSWSPKDSPHKMTTSHNESSEYKAFLTGLRYSSVQIYKICMCIYFCFLFCFVQLSGHPHPHTLDQTLRLPNTKTHNWKTRVSKLPNTTTLTSHSASNHLNPDCTAKETCNQSHHTQPRFSPPWEPGSLTCTLEVDNGGVRGRKGKGGKEARQHRRQEQRQCWLTLYFVCHP